jgi:cation-transporting ATPase 13A1
VDVKDTAKYTTLCLAAAHALVRLDDGTVVGDPMEKTTLEALDWQIMSGAQCIEGFHSTPFPVFVGSQAHVYRVEFA